MLEIIVGLLGISILVLAWIVIRVGERLNNLESRLQITLRQSSETAGPPADSESRSKVPDIPQP
jgi:hypothetical protein